MGGWVRTTLWGRTTGEKRYLSGQVVEDEGDLRVR